MALFKARDVEDALDDLLEREKTLILSGQIDKLARLVAEKERLMRQLKQTSSDLHWLDRLRQSAARNQDLLDAVMRGIKSARERIEALQANRSELRTYTSQGTSQNLARNAATFELKA